MVVSSTLVNVSDDAEVRLVSLLAEGAPAHLLGGTFQADCQKCIEAGEAGPLLSTVLKDAGAMAALLTIEADDEAVAAFSLLAALLERANRPSHDLASALLQTTAVPESEERKIALLAALYNLRSDANEKVELLRHMIELAGKASAQQPNQLLAPNGSLGHLLSCEGDDESTLPKATCLDASQPPLVSLLDSWHIQDRVALYQAITSTLPASDVRKQRFVLLLVASFTAANGTSDVAREAAQEAAVGVIRDPVSLFALQRNLLALPAIQALSQTQPVLLELLRVFQEGTLADYRALLQAKGGVTGVLAPWALNPELCERNMRILSLCSVAAHREEIPYSAVVETLQLTSEAEVESWVIAAVSSGLLQAKMDQLQHKVLVERSVVRRFDAAQWKLLQTRLRMWKQNVGSILTALKESQAGT